MTDVRTMATNVLSAAGTSPIGRLNIIDHGNSSGVSFGSDWIDLSTFSSFEPTLITLRGHFGAGGFVHLQHCQTAANTPLMVLFAQAFQVPVYAGTGDHNSIYRINEGHYVRCIPGGICATSTRP